MKGPKRTIQASRTIDSAFRFDCRRLRAGVAIRHRGSSAPRLGAQARHPRGVRLRRGRRGRPSRRGTPRGCPAYAPTPTLGLKPPHHPEVRSNRPTSPTASSPRRGRSSRPAPASTPRRLYDAGGGVRFYDYSMVPVIGDGGAVEAVAGTSRDITERERTEDLLREGHQFFPSSIDALASTIATLDEAGVILAVNDAWRRPCRQRPPMSPTTDRPPLALRANAPPASSGVTSVHAASRRCTRRTARRSGGPPRPRAGLS